MEIFTEEAKSESGCEGSAGKEDKEECSEGRGSQSLRKDKVR